MSESWQVRYSGRSSDQMMSAPKGATFIIPSRGTRSYYENLAQHLGRGDLKIEDIYFLDISMPYRALDPDMIVVDHATWQFLTPQESDSFRYWRQEKLQAKQRVLA